MFKRTPLYEVHRQLGARMVEFGGWEMPVQYKGVIEEHKAVREKVGLFDISHMGEIFVEGERAQGFINFITTNDITRIKDGGCQYAACCYENGTVVDDVISYQFSPQKYLVVVNASNTQKDFDWFVSHNHHKVTIINKSSDYCQLALQGPLSQKVLQPLVEKNLSELNYYTFCETQLMGSPILLSRTGYTGEDGFEIYASTKEAVSLWNGIMEAGKADGLQPIGLAARDTLRLEAAYSLYGHEISDSINPLEARLQWIVRLDKSAFIGKEVLAEIASKGVSRKIIGLVLTEPGVPRQGYKIVVNDDVVGVVTSGTFSPTLNKPIALALVQAESLKTGSDIFVEIRGQKKKAALVSLPFYKKT